MNGKLELFIERSFYRGSVNIHARIQSSTGHDHLYMDKGDLKCIKINPSEAPPEEQVLPLLSIPESMFKELIKEFANYASENDIKTENENLLKGKLTATENHLLSTQSNFDKLLDAMIKKK